MMIKHVVIWKFQPEAEGNGYAANQQLVQKALLNMRGRIDGLIDLETGVEDDRMVLISLHRDRESLQLYQKHPVHLEVKALVAGVTAERMAVDYPVDKA